MKHQTHTHRLDILKTRIRAVESAARELSKPLHDGYPYTFIEVGMLRDLLYTIDEVQERMHSVFVVQSANDLMMVRMKDDADLKRRMQEDADLKRLFQDGDNHA
jgi:hypothetical protein